MNCPRCEDHGFVLKMTPHHHRNTIVPCPHGCRAKSSVRNGREGRGEVALIDDADQSEILMLEDARRASLGLATALLGAAAIVAVLTFVFAGCL